MNALLTIPAHRKGIAIAIISLIGAVISASVLFLYGKAEVADCESVKLLFRISCIV